MRRITRNLIAVTIAAGLAAKAGAFSLMGPFASWQTTAIGYNLPASLGGLGDVGGPMLINEEYRLNTPVLTYGFDGNFLFFFGANGVAAVNAAMSILNDIPAASAMSASLAEFPLQAIGPANATAASLQIRDLKSATLSTVLGQLGLAAPERWVFTLRDRLVVGGVTNYVVIQRHYDPVTLLPTNVVNGVLYTYNVRDPVPNNTYADAVETRASGNPDNITAASIDDRGGLGFGQFMTGLTRDDIGGLRHLLRFNNLNVETLNASVTLRPSTLTTPYAPVTGTNGTNSVLPPFNPGFPFAPIGSSGTNTNNPVLTNVLVATARRPGIGKVSFNPMPVDALLNLAITPVTNMYTDFFYQTNSLTLTNQQVQRVTTIPDILFSAGDLYNGAPFSGATLQRPTATRWVNNSALQTFVGGTNSAAGPGLIPSAGSNATAIVITFNSLGPSRLNFTSGGFVQFLDEGSAINNGVWGYFDTTIYSVFPDGITIQDLERQLFGQ